MKRILASAVLILVIVVGAAFAINRNDTSGQVDGKLSVITTFYPMYEFAKNVGGGKVHVTNVTPAGAEPHDYEPSPKALAQAQDAAVFIYNGGTFEPWTDKFVAGYKHVAIKASDGITLHEGEPHAHEDEASHADEHAAKDPHFWLDPVLAQQIVNNIRDGLSKADPANKAFYAQQAAAYNKKLAELDMAFKTGLASCQLHTIITSHDSFSYVAERYGFTVESIAGLSPDNEPSAARLAELSDHVREENIKYVLFERLVSPRLADTIAQETGAQTLVLDPIEGLSDEDQKQGKTYLSIQRENLANLRTALACQ